MTDKQLLNLLKNSPDIGLEALMNKYMGLVYTIVSGKLTALSKEEAEECASDVFYEFYKNLKNIDLEKGTIKAYIAVVAKRRAIDRSRRLGGKIFQTVSIDELEPNQPFAANHCTEDIAADSEMRKTLIKQIKALGRPDSEIFMRKYFLGQSTSEIAKEIKIKENTIDKKISRGIVKLRKTLGGTL